MKLGLVCLVAAYILSQFFRAFLAVLAPSLDRDLGAGPDDLALASGLWFLTFAMMQIPVGAALDRIGPRRASSFLLAFGTGGGSILFAVADSPMDISAAMALIGIGCSPVLMAAYFIFARSFPPAMFATLAAAIIGVGSLGNIAGSIPLALAVDAIGWRATIGALGIAALVIAGLLFLTLQDPERHAASAGGSVFDVLRIPGLWPIFAMMFVCYAPSAGLRALWVGPFMSDVNGATEATIGLVTLVMGLSMVAGNFAYGPLDRLLGTRKWVNLCGNLTVALACLALWALPNAGLLWTTVFFAIIGLAGSTFGIVIAHGRAFVPPHLMGRGVTLLNLFGIAGAGIAQVFTGRLHAAASVNPDPGSAYQPIFLYFALTTLVGLGIYLFSRDRTD